LLLKKLKRYQGKRPKALILINIDSFEDINDFFGYDFGDKVLQEISKWLMKHLPDEYSELYKLEADNFAIFTEKYTDDKELNDYLSKLSSEIINMNFLICDNELDIGFTIGAAINSDNLLKLTHSAFKKSKLKKTQFEIYHEDKNSDNMHEKNIKISKIIKRSIQNHNVVPFFQPIYNIRLHKVDKYESLMRIKLDDGTFMEPAEFLQISKHSKLYPRLTKEMFNKVVDGINSSKVEYSINLSVDDILDNQTRNYILEKLEKSDVGSWLVFEILESEGIKNYKEVTRFLREIKALGAKIAIDDFGSGYSNFEYILKLDVDFLKIDGSLIRNIDINEDTQIIAGTIVDFAKKLNIKTIAEFVHNKDIYDRIKAMGFDYAQGYYIGKPDPHLITSKDLGYLNSKDEINLFTI
jgi:diguanylate cyclase (GGDEF)-like protein